MPTFAEMIRDYESGRPVAFTPRARRDGMATITLAEVLLRGIERQGEGRGRAGPHVREPVDPLPPDDLEAMWVDGSVDLIALSAAAIEALGLTGEASPPDVAGAMLGELRRQMHVYDAPLTSVFITEHVDLVGLARAVEALAAERP